MGVERETYEAALNVLKASCLGVDIYDGITSSGEPVRDSAPYDYDEKRVELAKWIVQNIWSPVDEAA